MAEAETLRNTGLPKTAFLDPYPVRWKTVLSFLSPLFFLFTSQDHKYIFWDLGWRGGLWEVEESVTGDLKERPCLTTSSQPF